MLAGGEAPAFSEELVQQIYRDELGARQRQFTLPAQVCCSASLTDGDGLLHRGGHCLCLWLGGEAWRVLELPFLSHQLTG